MQNDCDARIDQLAVPASHDPDAIVRRIRRGFAEGNDGWRITVLDERTADAVNARLTRIERSRVAVKWADFPVWDLDPYSGEFIEWTDNALRKQ